MDRKANESEVSAGQRFSVKVIMRRYYSKGEQPRRMIEYNLLCPGEEDWLDVWILYNYRRKFHPHSAASLHTPPLPALSLIHHLTNLVLNDHPRLPLLLDEMPRSNIRSILQLLVLLTPRLKRKVHKRVAIARGLGICSARQDSLDTTRQSNGTLVVHGEDSAVVVPAYVRFRKNGVGGCGTGYLTCERTSKRMLPPSASLWM